MNYVIWYVRFYSDKGLRMNTRELHFDPSSPANLDLALNEGPYL